VLIEASFFEKQLHNFVMAVRNDIAERCPHETSFASIAASFSRSSFTFASWPFFAAEISASIELIGARYSRGVLWRTEKVFEVHQIFQVLEK